MCFSANASYGSAVVLIAVGAVTSLGNLEKSRVMISIVPFLFGVQQLAEGIIWQTMGQNTSWLPRQYAILTFLGFALAVWPSFIPWAIFYVETDIKRKNILRFLGRFGFFVSVLAGWILLTSDLSAYSVGHGLTYRIANFPRHWPAEIEFFLYVVPTMLPFFVSTLQEIKKAGYLTFAAMLITLIVNQEALASVWCFFAALISIYIAVDVIKVRKGTLA